MRNKRHISFTHTLALIMKKITLIIFFTILQFTFCKSQTLSIMGVSNNDNDIHLSELEITNLNKVLNSEISFPFETLEGLLGKLFFEKNEENNFTINRGLLVPQIDSIILDRINKSDFLDIFDSTILNYYSIKLNIRFEYNKSLPRQISDLPFKKIGASDFKYSDFISPNFKISNVSEKTERKLKKKLKDKKLNGVIVHLKKLSEDSLQILTEELGCSLGNNYNYYILQNDSLQLISHYELYGLKIWQLDFQMKKPYLCDEKSNTFIKLNSDTIGFFYKIDISCSHTETRESSFGLNPIGNCISQVNENTTLVEIKSKNTDLPNYILVPEKNDSGNYNYIGGWIK